MNDFDVLKKCKQAYEVMIDLKENYEFLNEYNVDDLDTGIEIVSDIYANTWERLASSQPTYNKLKTNITTEDGRACIISDMVSSAYLVEMATENIRLTEMEVTHKRYAYNDFDSLEQAREELLKYAKRGGTGTDLALKINKQLTGEEEEDKAYQNELIEEVMFTINKIIRETNVCWWKE